MNPRTKFDEAERTTARAFVQLFVQHGDCFHYGVDNRTNDDDRELEAHLSHSTHEDDEDVILIKGIDMADEYEALMERVREMGLEVITEDEGEDESEYIGEYHYNTAEVQPDGDRDYEWDVPHLVFYGSLSPELEEACYAAFGHAYEYKNVRNHVVVFGDGLPSDAKTTLSDTVQTTTGFFEEDRDFVKSEISTGDLL